MFKAKINQLNTLTQGKESAKDIFFTAVFYLVFLLLVLFFMVRTASPDVLNKEATASPAGPFELYHDLHSMDHDRETDQDEDTREAVNDDI